MVDNDAADGAPGFFGGRHSPFSDEEAFESVEYLCGGLPGRMIKTATCNEKGACGEGGRAVARTDWP